MSESQEVSVLPAGTRVYCKLTASEANRVNVYLVDNEAFEDVDPELFLVSSGTVMSATVDGSEICGSDVKVRLKLDEENVKFDLFNGSMVKFVSNPCDFSDGTACGDSTFLEWCSYSALAKDVVKETESSDEKPITIPSEIASPPTTLHPMPPVPAGAEFVFGSFSDPLEQLPGMLAGLSLAFDSDGDLKASVLEKADDIRGKSSDMILWFGDKPSSEDEQVIMASILPNYMVEKVTGYVVTRIKVQPPPFA